MNKLKGGIRDAEVRKEIEKARKQDLYEFLLLKHNEEVIRVGNTLKLKQKKSVKIRKGYAGYIDYATGERGNSIDLLMQYFGYSFGEAVDELLNM